MKVLVLAAALAVFASPSLAVPMCDQPMPDKNGMVDYGFGPESESESAAQFERALRAQGIDAHQTRFWNGCIQTFVKVDGRDQMQFFNPDTLRQIPTN